MRYFSLPVLILSALFLISCAVKQQAVPIVKIIDRTPVDEALKLAVLDNLAKNIKRYDMYSGMVNISISNGEKKSSFGALLKKDAGRQLLMSVLGVFNISMAEIEYSDGVLKAVSRGKDITQDIAELISEDEIKDMLDYMDTAYIIPDESYGFYRVDNFKVFYKNNLDIYTTDLLAVAAYYTPERSVEYTHDALGRPVEIFIKKSEREVRVKFIAPAKWISSIEIEPITVVDNVTVDDTTSATPEINSDNSDNATTLDDLNDNDTQEPIEK